MSEQLTFIPASEAAEMVGVSAQTIRNLCKAKTIRFQMRTNLFYPCKEDMEKYAQSISEINQIERDIENYKKEINKASEQLRNSKEDMDGRLADMNMFPERIKNITNLLLSIVPHFIGPLSEREVEVLLLVLRGEKMQDIAAKLGLTRERTRLIYEKSIRKIERFPDNLLVKDARIKELEQRIQELEIQLNGTPVEMKLDDEKAKLLASSVEEIDLPVRAWIRLKAVGIETVDDLVKFPRGKLLNFRNFGKKSLQELEEWLAKNGLISDPDEESIPDKSIDYCQFSVRTYNALIAAKVDTVGDLLQMRRIDLQNIRNFGPKSVTEVEEWMTAHNLSLKENIPGPYVNTRHRKNRTRK